MDTSGFCQVGRHGTLSLLKTQNVGGAGDGILTSFGIDDEELTFGSSPACSVRLYYSDVDSLHCKIVFDQFKAFLTILGSSGVIVDECRVFPHTSGETSGSMQQTIIPLNNNSIFEIHGKRFKFNYPPKELRKALYSTPARPPPRALRLSMIHSAQVFSPRPSNDPRENLRILQSPMKRPSTPVKNPSPLKSATLPDIEEEEIVLVQTNHPRVVEEEKDLVILEDIPVQLLSPIKTTLQQTNQFPVLQAQNQPPCTPRRRSLGGTALHRAVLIRSAQRAVLKAEKEIEEEQEELEVFGTVVGMGDVDDETALRIIESEEIGDLEMSDEDDEIDGEDEDGEAEGQTQKSLWRKSLEQIIPWSLNNTRVETEDEDLQDIEADEAMTKKPEYQNDNPVGPFTPQPPRKLLGTFLTPQPQHQTRTIDTRKAPTAQAGRFSLGGQARRIIVEQPWKVHDLVLPPTTPSKSDSNPLIPTDPPSPNTFSFDDPSVASPWRMTGTPVNGNSIPAITDEERKAIQERRKSAVREFNSTPFWAGGAPGMSPAKGGLDSSNMFSSKLIETSSPSKRSNLGSPTKTRPSNHIGTERSDSQSKDDEDLDTSGLLDKIKETVNNMKRRRSVILNGSNVVGTTPSPISESEDLPTYDANVGAASEESSVRKVDFTKIGSPLKTSKHHSTKTSPQKNSGNAEEHTDITLEEEPFSLLRPGALEGRRQSILSTPVRKEQAFTVVPVPLIIVEDTAMDKSEELPKETVTRGRTRLLRSGSTVTEDTPDVGMEDDGGDIKSSKATKSGNAKPPSAGRQRSKTPQPQMSIDAASEVPSADVSLRASRSAAKGKATADTALKQIPEEGDAVEKPTRRVRKAQTIDKGEDEAKPIPVAPKRGRPRKNPLPIEKSQDVTRPAGKSTSKVRSRATPTTNMRETDSEDDPLDSYEMSPQNSAEENKELASDSPSTPEAQTKTKTPVPVTRGKVATRTNQEEPIEDFTLPVAATRVRRSAKVNTDTHVTPAVKVPTGRPRGRPKTPATAPANTGTSVAEEKENTVGSRSKLKSTEKVEAEELPVKLRVSRSRAAPSTRNAAKAAEQDDEQPPRQRVTRVMRTRTKTG